MSHLSLIRKRFNAKAPKSSCCKDTKFLFCFVIFAPLFLCAFVSQDPQKKAETLFDSGQVAHQSGDFHKAIDLYTQALKLDASLWQAEYQRGSAYLSINKIEDAKSSLIQAEKLLTEYPDSTQLKSVKAKIQVMIGEIALSQSKPAEAEITFNKAIEIDSQSPSAARAKSMMGIVLAAQQKYDQALPLLDETLKNNPDNVIALTYRARIFLSKNKIEEAKTDYNHVIKIDPNNEEAKKFVAVAAIESGSKEDAIAQLESLIKATPDRADLHAKLAELYYGTAPDKALEQYQIAMKLDPTKLQYQEGIGEALVKLRRFNEAIPVLRKVLEQKPDDQLAYTAIKNLATAYQETDNYPEAARAYSWILGYTQTISDKRANTLTKYLLAICFDKLRDYPQALSFYESFLATATPENQLEIDKVKLRMPSLQRQAQKAPKRKK